MRWTAERASVEVEEETEEKLIKVVLIVKNIKKENSNQLK